MRQKFTTGPLPEVENTWVSLMRGVSAPRKVELIESTTYPSGNVKLRYAAKR